MLITSSCDFYINLCYELCTRNDVFVQLLLDQSIEYNAIQY